ncbi:MAG: cytochrome P450 [Actinomycetota bacterium]|nr:cytochrome P450 [Actinomycetota bacterium]
MSTLADAKAAALFGARLHAGRAQQAFEAHVRHDLFSQLGMRPGRDDPYPVYERVRARGPFVWTRMGNLATVDHGICSQVLRSRRFGVRPEGDSGGADSAADFDLSFLERNPPDHDRLRRVVAPAFTPKQMESYRPRIERTVDILLDRAAAQGEFDLVESLAAPLPIAVITELLGIPDPDAATFARYGAVIGGALEGVKSLRQARELMQANAELERVFTTLFELRRREPRQDLVSHIVAAAGEQLHPREMLPLCALLLFAGFETTVNLVGNAVQVFLSHPGEWARLTADPGLAGSAVEEVLRFDPPVQRTARVSFDETELAGVRVGRGQFVNVLIGGANRDPAVYDDPTRFDITRATSAEHLAFSAGIHYCLGQSLARLEARIALAALATRMPRLRAAGKLVRRNTTLIRGPLRLPVAVQ